MNLEQLRRLNSLCSYRWYAHPSMALLANTSLRYNFNLFGTLSYGSFCFWPARERPEKNPVRCMRGSGGQIQMYMSVLVNWNTFVWLYVCQSTYLPVVQHLHQVTRSRLRGLQRVIGCVGERRLLSLIRAIHRRDIIVIRWYSRQWLDVILVISLHCLTDSKIRLKNSPTAAARLQRTNNGMTTNWKTN